MGQCRFNTTHIFPAPEIASHEGVCPDRVSVELFASSMLSKRKIKEDDLDQEQESRCKQPKPSADDDDKWSDVSQFEVEQSQPLTSFHFRLTSTVMIRKLTALKKERNASKTPTRLFTSST